MLARVFLAIFLFFVAKAPTEVVPLRIAAEDPACHVMKFDTI